MLHIELKDKDTELTFDVESEFLRIDIPDTELNRALIKDIEHGEYLDSTFFIDRFGSKLYLTDLSTSCKAALLVANTDKNVDVQECGPAGVSAIVRLCHSGKITMMDRGITIMFRGGNPRDIPVDVAIDGYHVKDMHTLNHYLKYMMDLDDDEYNAEKLPEDIGP